jgi:hypothetical protein
MRFPGVVYLPFNPFMDGKNGRCVFPALQALFKVFSCLIDDLSMSFARMP